MRLRWVVVPLVVLGIGVVGGFLDAKVIVTRYATWNTVSESMGTTLPPGAKVIVRAGRTPARGDVVEFRAPSDWPAAGDGLVKRVVGVAGDTVACCDGNGRLTVNGRSITEDYVHSDPPGPQMPFPTRTVPPGQVFVVGDNRTNSLDSRFAGPVPVASVTGVAVATWPSLLDVRPMTPTGAFTAAGLPGAPGADSWIGTGITLLLVAGLLVVVALLWLLVLGVVALVRRARRLPQGVG